MVRRRSAERQQFWQDLVSEQPSSGLTVSEFCRRRKVSPASFYAWRGKLSRASSAQKKKHTPDSPRTPVFVPVPLGETVGQGQCYEIKLPSGVCVTVPPEFEVSVLANVLQTLARFEGGYA